jgi:hypothetical protein
MVETTSQEQPLGADAPLLVSIRGTARTEIRRDRRLSRKDGMCRAVVLT